MRQVALFGFMLARLDLFRQMPAHGVLVTPCEIFIEEFTGGEVNFRGWVGHELEKMLRYPLPPTGSSSGMALIALDFWSWLKGVGRHRPRLR